MLHPTHLTLEKLLEQCEVRRTRRSGPGGQHRNKVETAVVVKHLPSGTSAEASERRSQQQNYQQAVERLRVRLALKLRSPIGQAPSDRWQGRVRGQRVSVSTAHEDFAALLAEALDALAAHEFEFAATARWLHVSSSQLQKLLKAEPAAWQLVQHERRARDLPSLS